MFKASRGIEDIYELTYIPQGWQPLLPGGGVRLHRCATRRKPQSAICSLAPNSKRSPAERDLQQREFLVYRHRRPGRHSDFQCRRGKNARLRRLRRNEQDYAGRYFGSPGADRARRSAEPRARDPDHARLRAPVFKAARGIEDIYELTYIRKDGEPVSAVFHHGAR